MNETKEIVNETSVDALLEDFKKNKDQFLARSVAGRFGENFRYSIMWLEKFQELYEYKKQYKHCNVPAKYENQSLYKWVQMQRYRISKLSEERKQMLNAIGFNWTAPKAAPKEEIATTTTSKCRSAALQAARMAKWDDKFEMLKQYKLKHGHCNVPTKKYSVKTSHSPSTYQLGNWVRYQRTQYSLMLKGLANNLTKEKIQKLESIGFNQKSQTKTQGIEKKNAITPTKNEKPKIFKMTNEGSCRELQTNGKSHASVGKSECDAQIEPASSNAVCHEQEDRKVRHDEQIAGEASCTKSRRDNASKSKLEIGKDTDNDSYKCLMSTNEKGTSESIIRHKVHQEQDDSEIRKNNEDFTVKESQTETIDKSSSSLQDKVQILCKISILFREEKDAAHAKIKKRKFDNSLLN